MTASILIWENDPASSGLVGAAQPNIRQLPFQFTFPPPHLTPDADTTTPGFRYWNAAEALKRGADFWGTVVPDSEWFCGPDLEVRLNVGIRWNANYDRRALNFFRGQVAPGNFIYASASADMLCHELGHAILDAVQVQLWHSSNEEVAAFHESFGDVSAILCALQLPSMRSSILASTGGHIFCNSRLSRIAEQFGTALYARFPDDAEPDCLRNAYNTFPYAPPADLDPSGPSSIVTSKPHSFSRIFTGAVLEILDGMLAVHSPATSAQLRDVTIELRDIMIEAVIYAPLVPQYYASVAAKMLLAAADRNPAYQPVFRDVFVRRLILSAGSAAAILSSSNAAEDTGFATEVQRHSYKPKLGLLPFAPHGLDRPLYIELPAEPEETVARSATRAGKSITPLGSEEAAQIFADRLFVNGLVEYGEFGGRDSRVDPEQRDPSRIYPTHRLELVDEQLRLRRVRIHCGNCRAA
jgi:hypothetical protein